MYPTNSSPPIDSSPPMLNEVPTSQQADSPFDPNTLTLPQFNDTDRSSSTSRSRTSPSLEGTLVQPSPQTYQTFQGGDPRRPRGDDRHRLGAPAEAGAEHASAELEWTPDQLTIPRHLPAAQSSPPTKDDVPPARISSNSPRRPNTADDLGPPKASRNGTGSGERAYDADPSYTGSQHRSGPSHAQPPVQPFRESMRPYVPSSPRHPSLPLAGIGGGSPSAAPQAMYAAPVNISQQPRAYAQQPTYVIPSSSPNPINPVYSPAPPAPPPEEICVECAMRDQDMADVDVTSTGVWDRESDVHYRELVLREEEAAAAGISLPDDPDQPRANGDALITPNLKVWLSMNPKEPTSRQQTLNSYIKSQRAFLEAEAEAHSRAMAESRQLDNKMRDAYSQLRRSAYDLGSSHAPVDDIGGVRIKSPRAASLPSNGQPGGSNTNAHAREVTLLENGMIVEHVDVRREEKEERERRRREERREKSRARKSSRGSGADILSVYSTTSPQAHDGFNTLKPGTRYSQASSGRPASVLTAPALGGANNAVDYPPALPRALSQASFTDVHSLGAASPRRSRFLGSLGSLSPWRSQDSLAQSGMSGSMIDMHVALQREERRRPSGLAQGLYPAGNDSGSHLDGQWTAVEGHPTEMEQRGTQQDQEKALKKKKGLIKFWRLVTGQGAKSPPSAMRSPRSQAKTEDDYPLTPPPPLSYLVDRRQGGTVDHRHVSSMPSLPSGGSTTNFSNPSPAMSLTPATTASSGYSGLPSPTSGKYGERKEGSAIDQKEDDDTTPPAEQWPRTMVFAGGPDGPVHVQEARGRPLQSPWSENADPMGSAGEARPMSAIQRDKSLPPLPSDVDQPRSRSRSNPMPVQDMRPQTVMGVTYDPRSSYMENPTGARSVRGLGTPQAPFRSEDHRRQSFSGASPRPNMSLKSPSAAQRPTTATSAGQDEFGMAIGSSYPAGSRETYGSRTMDPDTVKGPKKRRSKFGLSSLFGKKSSGNGHAQSGYGTAYPYDGMPAGREPSSASGAYTEFPLGSSSSSDARHEIMAGAGAQYGQAPQSSVSNHSNHGPRMSVASRKALAELVDQDRDFVAYRYPSNSQSVELLR